MRNEKQRAAMTNASLEGENGFSLISNETLIKLYANLLKCRLLDQRLTALAKHGSRSVPAGSGVAGEAATVGVVMDLVPEDTISSMGKGFVAAVLNGASPATAFSSFGRAFVPNPDFGALLHTAVGAALTHKTKKNGKVAVVFWPEGESAHWQGALDAARAHGLPIIFVFQVDFPTERGRRPAPSKPQRITVNDGELGLPRITVDGNDAVAVYRVAHESIARARLGRGPTLIRAEIFRPNGYGKGQDSISNMEIYLRGKGLYNREVKKRIVEDFTRELDSAMKAARKKAPTRAREGIGLRFISRAGVSGRKPA